jgi:hypothetical protein
VHFKFFAPEPKEYAVNRYTLEAERHWNIINDHKWCKTSWRSRTSVVIRLGK